MQGYWKDCRQSSSTKTAHLGGKHTTGQTYIISPVIRQESGSIHRSRYPHRGSVTVIALFNTKEQGKDKRVDYGSAGVTHCSSTCIVSIHFSRQSNLFLTQIISWCPNQKDHLWNQETIWSVIQSFPALRYLHIDTEFLQFAPTFQAFTTLESISIDASTCSEISWLYTSLSKLYASCPTLTSLAISDGSGYDFLTTKNSVDQIFLGCSKNTPASRLRRLCLHDCFVRIDKFTLPHLRQLTSLELLCGQHRDPDWGLDSCAHPRDIWSTFIGSGIQLEELVHNTTTTSLIDYLSSYSGLKKLKLSVSQFTNASSSDEAATRFFNDVLPRHVETLESLSLEAYYEGEWCFTSRNTGVIKRCTKLNRLLISVVSKKSRNSHSLQQVNAIASPDKSTVVRFFFQASRLSHILH